VNAVTHKKKKLKDDAEPVDPVETDDSIPGFTSGVALLALLVSSGMLWYRQR